MEALRYVLNAREDFDRIRSALARDSPASDVQRAAWFYQLIRYSYASRADQFWQPAPRYAEQLSAHRAGPPEACQGGY